jgi:hypothetical protein
MLTRLSRTNPVGSCLGRYHTGRQPGAALQYTAMWPGGPMCPAGRPPARVRLHFHGVSAEDVADILRSQDGHWLVQRLVGSVRPIPGRAPGAASLTLPCVDAAPVLLA